jgi:hypothetical protein
VNDRGGEVRIGIVVNPAAGRDVRRLAARAASDTPQSKRNSVARAVIGAAAAGATHFCVVREPFQIGLGAVENLRVSARFEAIDVGASLRPEDTARAVEAMRKAGCRVLVVLGGDGTNRLVARAWRDAVLLPLSTGTNNVFPHRVEPTAGGAAAGAVAAGAAPLELCAPRAKRIEVEIEDEPADLALIDAAFLVGDSLGNLMPFDPEHLRLLVLTRAEPHAVGMSPIGGLLEPCGAADEAGVLVACAPTGECARPLLAAVSPGLYRRVGVTAHRRLAFGEPVEVSGPGLLAFDGDRARALRAGQRAWLRVRRSGPHVIDPALALGAAAQRGWFAGRHWHDALDEPRGAGCC